MIRLITMLIALSGSMALGQARAASEAEEAMNVYLGTMTGQGGSQGIYRARLDLASGALSPPELVAKTSSPGFLAIHPNRRFLYAVNHEMEVAGQKIGAVSSFKILPDGQLQPINTHPAQGETPCHLSVDTTGQVVLVASYSSGNVTVLPIKPDGSLQPVSCNIQHTGSSVDPQRQKQPYAHSIYPDPTNRFALACDLGTDQVLIYKLDPAKGQIVPNDPPAGTLPPGSGPRHLAFHPGGKFVYVVNEINNTVTAFEWDAQQGAMDAIQTITTLPEDFTGKNYCSEIAVHPSGRFLYAANRGHESLAVFAIDDVMGTIESRGQTPLGGKWPRHFAIDPTGKFLITANENSNDLIVFRIDPMNGSLTRVGEPVKLTTPMCVRFMPPVIE